METQLQNIAKLIGDPVRATILWTLLDGKAYTATELAVSANTSLQNTSMHLNKLMQADLLSVEKQGRHRYFRFSRDEVASAIEGLTNLVPNLERKEYLDGKELPGIQYCRTCYDHLAGRIGVLITENLVQQRHLQRTSDHLFALTTNGKKIFDDLQIDTGALNSKRRIFAKPCLDWSERKYHLAGSLGAALLDKMLDKNWVRKTQNSRVLVITGKGRKELNAAFHIDL